MYLEIIKFGASGFRGKGSLQRGEIFGRRFGNGWHCNRTKNILHLLLLL